ncbi:MAG: recombinase family protein [Actinobacteria bacterium]|nr:recombinase family protein [Actinomycetota bacterium]
MTTATIEKTQVRAGCYCRISSDPDDKREGVTRQREDTSALCEVKGWAVADYYVDNDRSASSGKERPEWERLLADIEAGKIDAIAAWEQDRGWRMMSELERLRKFFAGLDRHIPLATTGQGDIDLNTPTGVMLAQMKTAQSEHEIAMMSVRIRRAARQKAEQGRPAWKKAFGYLPETRRLKDDDGTRQIDPAVAPLVRKGYAAVLAGASLKDVAAMWNDAGALTTTGRRWDTNSVSHFLRHPRNAGLRSHFVTGKSTRGTLTDDIVGPGTWPALVEESVWRAAQTVLDSRPSGGRGGRRSVRKHVLTGVLRCGREGCDGRLGGTRTASGDVGYACTSCHKVSIRASYVEPWLVKLVGGRLAMPDAVDLLKAEIHDAALAQRLRDEKSGLYARLDEFALERAQGLMTGRQLQIASESVQAQIAAIERQEQSQERLRVFDEIPLGTEAAKAAVEALTPDRLRAVLGVLMTVTILPVGKVGHVFNEERVQVEWV